MDLLRRLVELERQYPNTQVSGAAVPLLYMGTLLRDNIDELKRALAIAQAVDEELAPYGQGAVHRRAAEILAETNQRGTE